MKIPGESIISVNRASLAPTKIRTRNARLYNEIGVQGYRNEFIDHVARH